MHFKSSLPVFCIALNALYHGTTAISASTWVLDFRNLVLPSSSGSPVPLGDFGGIKFQNVGVVHMVTQPLGTDKEGVIADAPDTTVAVIDPKTAPSGGTLTIPAGKQLKSFDFFCCSSKAGESVLEGHGCTQVKCQATAKSSGTGTDGKKIEQSEGVAVASPLSAVTDTAPGAIAGTSLVLANSGADFATGMAHAVTISFTGVDLPVGGGASSRMRIRGRRAASMKGADNLVLVITDMVITPVDAGEA
ncbi:hypothetical protein TWF281_005263 [Arthrobotrys megalospora]